MANLFPLLVIFDLECTLIPFRQDSDIVYPLKKNDSGHVTDQNGNSIKYRPDVPAIFKKFQDGNSKIAITSYSREFEGAGALMDFFGWNKFIISFEEIDCRNMTYLFDTLQIKTKVQYNRMMYFDNCNYGLEIAEKLGIFHVEIDPRSKIGMTTAIVDDALKLYEMKVQAEKNQNKNATN